MDDLFTDGRAVRVTLRIQPGAVPAAVRMRRALKCLLRTFGLKCERVIPVNQKGEAMIVKCRDCPALIRWVTMLKTGKKNPLNVLPNTNGNVRVLEGGENAEVIPKADLESVRKSGVLLFTSHFSNCPAAQKFRKK